MSAHCILKNINYEKHIKDLKKYVGIFGKQNPIWNGKELLKDIFGVILLIRKLKICIQNWRIGFFFIMPFQFFKKNIIKISISRKACWKRR